MEALAGAVNLRGYRTLAFNPLPWKRDAIINGSLVKDIPAGGYKALHMEPVSSTGPLKTGNTFENEHFKIVFDPTRGAIASLIDKRSGRELVDSEGKYGFGQYMHEKFSADEVAGYCESYIRGEKNEKGWEEFYWAYAVMGKPNMPPASEVPYRAMTAGNCNASQIKMWEYHDFCDAVRPGRRRGLITRSRPVSTCMMMPPMWIWN